MRYTRGDELKETRLHFLLRLRDTQAEMFSFSGSQQHVTILHAPRFKLAPELRRTPTNAHAGVQTLAKRIQREMTTINTGGRRQREQKKGQR